MSFCPTDLRVESFILRGSGVTDLDAFASAHEEYLVSIEKDPSEAARWWHWQKDKTNPGEGWVSFELNGIEIMPLEAWTNVTFFWATMIGIIEDFLATGEGRGTLSEESAEITLCRRGSIAILTLRGTRHPVDPQSLVSQLVGGMRRYYAWADAHVGVHPDDLARLERLAQRST